MNDSTSMFSAHALPNRAARRFALSRRRQRKAQALILAVLVMLMVAVLSAGFLLVVSGNLNQTARVTDQTRARESARSGLKFVNEQLTYSQLGENWRPGFVAVNRNNLTAPEQSKLAQGEGIMPQTGDSDFDLYYSKVDQANNWAGSFAKFPDPLAPRSDAPQYLARIQRVESTNPTNDPNITDPTDLDSQDPSKMGMLRITVIGLSNDDPAAFSKVVAYKGGQSSPFGRFMRTVTNWDFKNNIVPNAQIDPASASTATQLNLSAVQGSFPPVPFTVMVGNATTGSTLRSAVVTAVSATNQLTLAQALSPVPSTTEKERVEVAAQLGASVPVGSTGATQSAIDFNLDGSFPATENTDLHVSQPAATGPMQSGSIFVNGSVSFFGDLVLPDLVSQSAASPYYSSVRASGLMLRDLTSQKVSVSTRIGNGPQQDANGNMGASQLVQSSDIASSLLTSATPEVAEPLVSDGFNRLNNDPSSLRQTKPMTPPDISSSAGAGRYRQLTRDSKVNLNSQLPVLPNGTPDSASNYGYGTGMYINNPEDRERVYDAGTGKLRDMTQAELVNLWMSRKMDTTATPAKVVEDTTYKFERTATPATATDPNASLEEQHLRGWVAPDEFHARGPLIELVNATPPVIRVTFDSRADNTATATTNATGPVASKVAKKPDSSLNPGVYTQTFSWPANGVIFAEGNVRVRGEIDPVSGGAPRSLTIVSENNIYIDGSLNAAKNTPPGTPRKILLLARRNVIANPTQAIFRPESQTLAFQAVTIPAPVAPTPSNPPTTTDLPVYDVTSFTAGDIIETLLPDATPLVNLPQLKTVGLVNSVDVLNKTLKVVSLQGGAIAPNDIVRIRREDVTSPTSRAIIASTTDAIQRRLQVSDPNNLRLTFDHSADKINALAVSAIAVTPGQNSTKPVNWDFKRKQAADTDPSGNVVVGDKVAHGAYTSPAPSGTDMFPNSPLSTNGAANLYNLPKIEADLIALPPHTDPGPPVISWKYDALANTAYPLVPFHYLTAIRNRQNFGAPITPATPRNVDIRVPEAQTTAYQMILAASINPLINGNPVSMTSFGVPIDATHRSFFFGFCPDYTDITYQSPQVAEDGLTSDEAFYQTNALQTTLDSRTLLDPSGNPAVIAAGIYPFSLHEPAGLTGISDIAVLPATQPSPLPQYRFGHLKMEQMDSAGKVTPGYVMDIHAFVYAQYGSWFVIPNALFDKTQFKGTNTGATNSLFDSTESKDYNRNGSGTDPGEADAFLRYSRANYKVNFVGAIAENQTPLVNPVGSIPGAVQAWSNDWANYTETAGTIDASTAKPGVTYTFDPDYAASSLDPNDTGFVMPQTEELTYVE